MEWMKLIEVLIDAVSFVILVLLAGGLAMWFEFSEYTMFGILVAYLIKINNKEIQK